MTPDFARRPYQDIVEYMLGQLSTQGILTDMAPGSVTRTLVEATAREFSELYARMNAVYEAGFLDTATGASLDQLVALIGLTRYSGETDVAELRLHRDGRVSARVVIPAGARIMIDRQGKSRATYAVIDGDELRAGESSLVVTLRALPVPDDPNADLSLSADDVALDQATFLDPIAGIAGLSLEGPSVKLGTNETDDQLRDRARMAIASAGGGTEKALEQALLEVEGVQGVRLRDAGDPLDGGALLRPGEIEVILDGKPQAIADAHDEIAAAIARAKGPGIVARLRGTTPVTLGGKIVIRPAAPTLSGVQTLELVRACEAMIKETIDKLEIGAGIQWNRLLAALMNVENLGDILIDQSHFALDGAQQPLGDISVTKTQRLTFGEGSDALICVPEDRPTLSITLTVAATIEKPDGATPDMFEGEVTQALIRYLETLDTRTGPVDLTHDAVIAALTGPNGVATLPDQITGATVTLAITNHDEGAEVVLNTGGSLPGIAQNTLLRVANSAVSTTWKDPA